MATEWEKYALWTGIVLTIVASSLLMAWATWLTFLPFAVGVGLVSWALYRYMGCQAGDERVRQITVYSLTNSWLATFFLVAMYVLFGVAGILADFTPMQVLAMTMTTMLIIFSAWFSYFWRKGDVA
jgi:preprotein translocase subunit SecY